MPLVSDATTLLSAVLTPMDYVVKVVLGVPTLTSFRPCSRSKPLGLFVGCGKIPTNLELCCCRTSQEWNTEIDLFG